MTPPIELLKQAAQGDSIPDEQWPAIREYILGQLDSICESQFPNGTQPSALTEQPNDEGQAPSKDETTIQSSSSLPTADVSSQPVRSAKPNPVEVITTLKTNIRNTLIKDFPTTAPYTIQRIAELTLTPNQHYKYLPSYLQAFLRVSSVSSGASIFPEVWATNGVHPSSSDPILGSDESLGGALLTPIEWLGRSRDATPTTGSGSTAKDIDSADDAKLESSPSGSEGVVSSSINSDDDEGLEAPHARGPLEIGVEDIGSQKGKGGGVDGLLEDMSEGKDEKMEVDNEKDKDQ